MDDSLFEEVAASVVLTAAQYYSSHYDKQMRRTSILSGYAYTKEILNGHSAVIQSAFRMPSLLSGITGLPNETVPIFYIFSSVY